MRFTAQHFDNIAREFIEKPRVPFHRCYRPLVKRVNSGSSEYYYLQDDDYARKPYMFTRAFEELQNELKAIFSYVEPSYQNRKTYSYKIQQLFIRWRRISRLSSKKTSIQKKNPGGPSMIIGRLTLRTD